MIQLPVVRPRTDIFWCAVLVFLWMGTPALAQRVLTLEDALSIAAEQNYNLQIARNDVAIARANVTPGNAGFLPTVNASAAYNGTLSNTNQSFLSGQTNEVTGALTTRSSAGLNMQWTVFEGLGRTATLNRLSEEFEQQQQSARNTQEAITSDIVLTYYDLVRQQEQLVVLEEAVAISGERLRIAELRRDLGSASELEVRQAQLDLNSDRISMLRQETALTNSKATFNQLLARPLDLNYTVADSIPLEPVDPQESLRELAMGQNTLLQIAEQERTIAALEIREIRSEWFPTLNASTGLNYSDLTAESGFLLSNQSTDFTYGLTLNMGIFDGFNRRRRVENAIVRQRNAELVIEDISTQIQSDVSRAYLNYANSIETIDIELESVGLARQNVTTALERFELGTITSIELREVQETLTRAQSLLLFAQYEAKQAEVELLRLTGRLVE